MRSTHLPELSGDILTFTGSIYVDTELRSLQTGGVTLAQASAAGAAHVTATPVEPLAGGTWKLLLQAWEDDLVTPAAVPTKVMWSALGK
jgi:hypothetical protein